ncbi:MAG: preprotein translocase subunit SecE [Ignavibacteria bacterium]|nr:preprotein translocase subunit SecE [Ignavibacteria bacterium]
MKEKIINYFNDVVREMKKVTWPTQEELKGSTQLIIITCIILAIFVYIIDQILSNIFKGIF